jgi:predicted TIM-barrel fold metal-dependent hydrolase
MKIFANHAHVFPESVRPAGTIARLEQLLDTCHIDGAVCFAPFAYQLEGTDYFPNPWLARQLASKPRLKGFGTVDLRRTDIVDQVKQIADFGFRGIKAHPQAQEFALLSPEAFKLYEAAQKHNLFITFHSGVHHGRIKDYRVLDFDEVAHHFPEMKFSMEHLGGYSFFADALAVIVNRIPFPPKPGKRCLVFGGMTSIFTQHYNRFWYMTRDRMLELIAQVGPQQLIFGLDFPYNLEEGTETALATLRGLGLSDPDLALILGGNLCRELGY